MKWTYFLINLFSILVPFLFSFHPRIRFHQHFKAFLKANVIVTFLFVLWDILFTHWGVWWFSSDYTLGISLVNLPLEEVLFFICIPFSCLFTFHCFSLFIQPLPKMKYEGFVISLIILFLMIIGWLHLRQRYTSVSFISTALLLFVLKFWCRVNWLSLFLLTYLVLLLPFFIVNGILTGTGLDHPVVSYNNQENLGIRLLTIPVEDLVYGLELQIANLYFFTLFNKSNQGVLRQNML